MKNYVFAFEKQNLFVHGLIGQREKYKNVSEFLKSLWSQFRKDAVQMNERTT